MAARPKGFGLTRELESKKRKEYDAELAEKVCVWFNEVCKIGNESQYLVDFGGDYSWENTHAKLKDGKLILAVANVISPSSKKKIQTLNSPFKLMENTGHFLATAGAVGVASVDLFQTASLYEGKSISSYEARDEKGHALNYSSESSKRLSPTFYRPWLHISNKEN